MTELITQLIFAGSLSDSQRQCYLLPAGDGDDRSVSVLSRHEPLHLVVTMDEIGDDVSDERFKKFERNMVGHGKKSFQVSVFSFQ